MYIKPCPKCGRLPEIKECVSYKNKTRRRMCSDPCFWGKIDHNKLKNYDCVEQDYCWDNSFFVFIGEGDDNNIYKIWNECLMED